MPQTLRLVREGIEELIRRVRANPLLYFNESDLQAELFSILLGPFNYQRAIKDIFVWGTDTPNTPREVFSRRLHSELLLHTGRIDLAVLDLNKMRIGINSRGKLGYIQLEHGRHVFIEIKASRTNRSHITSRNRWENLILADIKKLSVYSHPCFLLCFDFNTLFNDETVGSLMKNLPVNINMFYVRDDIHNRYFVTSAEA